MTKILRHICGEIVNLDDEGNYHPRFDRDCKEPTIDNCPYCHNVLEEGWFRPLYRVEPMSRGMMERTISGKYCCSNCWEYGLIVQEVLPEEEGGETLYRVLCASCLEETVGYVSGKFAAWMREQDYLNYLTVRRSLGEVMGVKLPERRSIEENLRMLGFGL